MENMIILFKAPWTQGSLNQPYFASNTARDRYLQTLPNVTLQLNNPNIKFEFNLGIELVVPMDYTLVTEYNFCKLLYNGKSYYATIEDYSLVSVGYSSLILYRHILSERTNFMQYFKSFQISKATNLGYVYKADTPIKKPTFRYKRNVINITPKCKLKVLTDNTKNPVDYTADCVYLKFLCIFRTSVTGTEGGPGIDNFYGAPSQYYCILIPLPNKEYDYYWYCWIDDSGYGHNYKLSPNELDVGTVIGYINEHSAMISSVKIINIPCPLVPVNGQSRPMIPFYWNYERTVNNDPDTDATMLYLVSTSYNPEDLTDVKYTYTYNLTTYYGDIVFKFYSNDVSIKLDKSEFTGTSSSIILDLYYFFDPVTDEILVNVRSTGNDSIQGIKKYTFYSCDMGDSVSYVVTAESTFNNANKYYEAMTNSVRNQKLISSIIGGSSTIGVGGSEYYYGSKFDSKGGKLSSFSLASGNVIRGISSLLDGIFDASFYNEQREIMAKNEKYGIDKGTAGGSGNLRFFESRYSWQIIEEIPFEPDWNVFVNELDEFGLDCNLFEENITISNYLVNDYFFLRAYALLNDSVSDPLSMPEYDVMYKLLVNGCRYHYIEQST